uniref:Uncharacterized protein n=1 Tax=Arundo donax TaxID=35708 RepID=A0A0A8YEH1_ARUDO
MFLLLPLLRKFVLELFAQDINYIQYAWQHILGRH